MKLIYKGKFDGVDDNLPKREPMPENTVPFKEAENMKKLALIANLIAVFITVPLFVFAFFYSYKMAGVSAMVKTIRSPWYFVALIMPLVLIVPHEFLHAICFKETVYLYTNLSKGMLFVTGVEDMSKGRFIFLSLLPNICFGFIPFVIFLFCPQFLALGLFSAVNIGAGAGDYYNVFNCLTQVPKDATVFMSGSKSYWYIK